MKERALSKIRASVAVEGDGTMGACGQPKPAVDYEMQSVDEWIAPQGVKLDRPEAIHRLVELGLKKEKSPCRCGNHHD